MTLYKHIFEHWSQKDSVRGIVKYFVAENDRDAYDIVYPTDCQTVDAYSYEDFEIYIEGEYYNVDSITEEMIRSHVADNQGEINMEMNLDDLYYGKTYKGWEIVQENILPHEIKVLRELKILEEEV